MYRLQDRRGAECDPDSDKPCCADHFGWCGNGHDYCNCPDCTDYRIVKILSTSEGACVVTAVGGFLKKVCSYNKNKSGYNYACPHSNVNYEIHFQFNSRSFSFVIHSVTSVCEEDPLSYQACGFNTRVTNTNHVLCQGYFCYKDPTTYRFERCDDCSADEKVCSPSGEHDHTVSSVSKLSRCDGKCDDWLCEDESECNNYRYGVHCTFRERDMYVPIQGVCDGWAICDGNEDEADCNVTEQTPSSCVHYGRSAMVGESVTVPILNYTRCGVFDVSPYCLNFLDQTNCSDSTRVGGYCYVNGFLSSVSKNVICHDYNTQGSSSVQICDDGMENTCVSPSVSKSCRVHKHKMCDGKFDCIDKSDETDDMCKTMTTKHTCKRGFGTHVTLRYPSLPLPVSWIMDGQVDCLDGLDEGLSEGWSFCGDTDSGTFRVKLEHDQVCQDVFLCPGSNRSYVHLDLLCDGVESCGTENEVCAIARDFPPINTSALYSGAHKDVCRSIFIPSGNPCVIKEFPIPSVDVFGVDKIKVNVPTSKVDCSNIFGELYVFLSCMDLCLNSSCPLENALPLLHDSCPGQYPGRTFTLANNSYLTFVTDTNPEGLYQQNYFQCHNGGCVQYHQVCDLIDDCGDFSDEINCTNHRVCADTMFSSKMQLISVSQTCDGIYDCYDLSDECNEDCGREILGSWVLACVCWLMGVLAILFNAVAMIRTIVSLKDNQSMTLLALFNKSLVTLISIGDLLVGVYLILLSVYDSIVFGGEFCRHQAEWLTSSACSSLGVLSTTGSQLSLFSMAALSIVRFVALLKPSLSTSHQINVKTLLKILPTIIIITVTSLLVALIPLAPSLEDYFVQGMFYDGPSYKIFTGFQNKAKHLQVLQAYYKTSNISADLTWSEIGSLVDGMFSQHYGRLERSAVHFYGNDGVCLFKYFVRSDDPRRSRDTLKVVTTHGNEMVWLMLLLNFLCFVVITVLYILISIKTRRSSEGRGQYHGLDQERKSRLLQRRITILIATDFLCWIPFIIISSLHNLSLIDATYWYVPFAMTVLPLNSVLNPLIYDTTVQDFMRRRWVILRVSFKRNDSTKGIRIAEGETAAGEYIGMGTMQTVVQE